MANGMFLGCVFGLGVGNGCERDLRWQNGDRRFSGECQARRGWDFPWGVGEVASVK
jgi:hypothetical protein